MLLLGGQMSDEAQHRTVAFQGERGAAPHADAYVKAVLKHDPVNFGGYVLDNQ